MSFLIDQTNEKDDSRELAKYCEKTMTIIWTEGLRLKFFHCTDSKRPQLVRSMKLWTREKLTGTIETCLSLHATVHTLSRVSVVQAIIDC